MGMCQSHSLENAEVQQMIAFGEVNSLEGTQRDALLEVDAQAIACDGHAEQLVGALKRHHRVEPWWSQLKLLHACWEILESQSQVCWLMQFGT